jgi:hypothetical protein
VVHGGERLTKKIHPIDQLTTTFPFPRDDVIHAYMHTCMHAHIYKKPTVPQYTIEPMPIPTEIYNEIYLYARGDVIDIPTSTSNTPLLLTAVSSRWRHIAIHTPRLWTSLYLKINLQRLTPSRRDQIRDGVLLWLSRSANFPLFIRLQARSPSRHIPLTLPLFDSFNDIMDAILTEARRITHLYLHLPQLHSQHGRPLPFPRLQSLSLFSFTSQHLIPPSGGFIPPTAPLLIAAAPRLHSLFMTEIDLLAGHAPFHHLQTLTLRLTDLPPNSVVQCLHTILQCQTLISLSILLIPPFVMQLTEEDEVAVGTLPALRRLSFESLYITDFAETILMPELEYISLSSVMDSNALFQGPSYNRLSTLKLSLSIVTSFRLFATAAPALATLHLDNCDISHFSFRMLSIHPQWFPLLQEFVWTEHHNGFNEWSYMTTDIQNFLAHRPRLSKYRIELGNVVGLLSS